MQGRQEEGSLHANLILDKLCIHHIFTVLNQMLYNQAAYLLEYFVIVVSRSFGKYLRSYAHAMMMPFQSEAAIAEIKKFLHTLPHLTITKRILRIQDNE